MALTAHDFDRIARAAEKRAEEATLLGQADRAAAATNTAAKARAAAEVYSS